MAETDIRSVLETRRDELARELEGLIEMPRDPMASVSFGKRIGDGTTEAVERLIEGRGSRKLLRKVRPTPLLRLVKLLK